MHVPKGNKTLKKQLSTSMRTDYQQCTYQKLHNYRKTTQLKK